MLRFLFRAFAGLFLVPFIPLFFLERLWWWQGQRHIDRILKGVERRHVDRLLKKLEKRRIDRIRRKR
jgi:hypothetical protein